MSIRIRHLHKAFGATVVCDDLNLDVHPGELLALLGPSGSGKTTLLRLMAGLERPDAGTLHLNGQDTATLGVRQRRTGFMFQHYALFDHLSVFENVAFGLRVRPRAQRPAEPALREAVMRLLERVQLAALAERRPPQLSGGQRQRVALARALAIEPQLLLLDEPFGALDARVRQELRQWLRALHDETQLTTVFVTHDQEEALEVADRVVVMQHGRIEQVGTPEQLWQQPANEFVRSFLAGARPPPSRVGVGLGSGHQGRDLHPGLQPELAQQVLDVDLHRRLGDAERAGDVLVALPERDQPRDLALAR
jgi:sulfate/thiosulfate transport system ATP-binding protein